MKKIILFLFAVLCSTSMFAWKVASNFASGTDTWAESPEISGDTYTSDGLLASTVYQFKVKEGDPAVWKGFENLDPSTVVCGIYGNAEGDCNICFELAEAGKVTITYQSGKIALSLVSGKLKEQEVALWGYNGKWDSGDLLNFGVSADKLNATYTIQADTLSAVRIKDFKVKHPIGWLSDGQELSRDRKVSDALDKNAGANMKIKLDVKGNYVLTYNFATRQLSVAFPDMPAIKYYVYGNFGADDSWYAYEMTEASGVWAGSVTPAAAKTQYEYKIKSVQSFYETYYGATVVDNEMTKENCTDWDLVSGDAGKNVKMTPANTGAYTFNFTPGTSKLSVTYPTPAAIDNTEVAEKVVKTMENGQLVIIKNGVRYNAQGTMVK